MEVRRQSRDFVHIPHTHRTKLLSISHWVVMSFKLLSRQFLVHSFKLTRCEFACSPCACVGFVQVLWLPPNLKTSEVNSRAVSTTSHLCTSRTYFECLVRSHWQNQQNSVHWKYPDGALETGKKWSVKRWTLRALSGRHLGYVAEEEEPFRQLFTRIARLFWQV